MNKICSNPGIIDIFVVKNYTRYYKSVHTKENKMAQAPHKTCEMCMRASALHFCTQCDQVFCDGCKVSHLKSKISRNHTVMAAPNINTEKKAGGCKDHNEDFIYLCEDCDQLICKLCVIKAHQKHYLVDIKDSNNKVQTEISKCLDSKVDNIRLSATLIEGKAKTYKTEVEATVKGIIEQGNLIKAMVDEKVNALIKVLRERERIELQSLSKANKDCPDLLGEASIHQQIYQDMIKQCDEVALFHKMKKIKSDVDNLKTVDITSLPSATYNRKNVNFSDVDQLFGNVTFQETEVTVKKTKLSAELHDQDKQPKQEMKKDQPPTTNLNQMNTELQQRAAIIESLQRTLQDLTYQINKKDEQIRDAKRETDDLRTRLSSLAGDKLTKGNPAITDLGDPNRPMKLAEKYGELYDNEWTDAMDCAEVKAFYPDMETAEIEEIIIRHLYQLVTCCYRECLALSKEQLEEVGNTIVNALKLNNEEHDRDIPGCKEVSKCRRQCAAEYADYLFKHKVIVEKIVLSDWEYVHKSNELVGLLTETPFFEKCVNLCWHMAIQDPVMHLDKELPPDTAYDKSVYREFVKSGDKVTFVVWPALFLHESGTLLSKGVVQAYC